MSDMLYTKRDGCFNIYVNTAPRYASQNSLQNSRYVLECVEPYNQET